LEHWAFAAERYAYFLLSIVAPKIAEIITRTMKMKKIVVAMDAAPAAIPVKPKIAAITAITRNIAVHFNIAFSFLDW